MWCALVVLVSIVTWRALQDIRADGRLQGYGAILAGAIALRLAVPFGPAVWYLGVSNTPLTNLFWSRGGTYQPWPLAWALFGSGAAIFAVRAYNLLIGVWGVCLGGWAVGKLAGNARTGRLFALLVAATPLYVRFSASDASHNTAFFLATCALAGFAMASTSQRWLGALTFAVAATLACPIRLESGYEVLCAPLLVLPLSSTLRVLRARPGLSAAVVFAWIAGGAWALAFHLSTIFGVAASFGAPRLLLLPVVALLRVALIVNPVGVFFIPPVLAVPVWWHLQREWRAGNRRALRDHATAILILSLPFLAHGGLDSDLGGAGYDIVFTLAILSRCAAALVALAPRLEAAWRRFRTARRAACLAAGAPLAGLFFVYPWVHTYSYQDEYRFLLRALPRGPATVVSLFDQGSLAHDFDCCLVSPYPLLYAQFPHIHWVTLSRTRANEPPAFDYFYPGTMRLLDTDSIAHSLIIDKPRDREKLQQHIETLRSLDEGMRRDHELVPAATETLRLDGTFGGRQFPRTPVKLVLYRQRDVYGATSHRSSAARTPPAPAAASSRDTSTRAAGANASNASAVER